MIGTISLVGAILFEVGGTIALRVAALGRRVYYVGTVVGYGASFTLLTIALRDGMGIGVAYGVWAAAGVALTSVLSKVIFDEPLTRLMVVGIVVVGAGVMLIEVGATQ